MFTQQLPVELFQSQREFIRVMDANRDFVWWADTLITEETKELQEAFNKKDIDMENLFKELGDLVYVVAGFYNVMPVAAPELVSAEINERLQGILDEAARLCYEVTNDLKIPLPIVVLAYELVHESNMSKVNPETGKPDRREDGKILKGPNYKVPDMTRAVKAWEQFQTNLAAQETQGNENSQ